MYVRRNKLLDKIISRLPNSYQLALPITKSLKCNGSTLFFLPKCKIHAPLQNRVARNKLTNKKGDANTKSLVKMRICFYWKKKKKKKTKRSEEKKCLRVYCGVVSDNKIADRELCSSAGDDDRGDAMRSSISRRKHLTSLSIVPSFSRG